MQLDKIHGPGVDAWLLDQLSSWGIKYLTEIQVLAVQSGIADGRSMVICAPTSSGKTLVGEIALLSALHSNKKALYLVSHKALADQKYDDFAKRFGDEAAIPLASVALSTGDRDEGDQASQLVVATYEKALGLLLTGEIDTKQTVVIADELQILGDPNRGPNIETLCALLRQNGVGQFVALTATVENPEDLAGWMECEMVISQNRDVVLHQEIWHQGEGYTLSFGQTEGHQLQPKAVLPSSLQDAVSLLLELGRGPVLVFTESRREAINHAGAFSQKRTRVADGIAISERLELFSEPTESSEQLRENAERQVAFHTADLTPQERQVIEQGFIDSKFEVCFATSTLAAGVNFPFKSVVFPKLTYQYGARSGTTIPRGEYRNMSGRAGRLGMHEEGFSILLPKNGVELAHANQLVLPENERVISQLVSLSMRRTVLTLVASGVVDRETAVQDFFKHTLYWYQTLENNPTKLKDILRLAFEAIHWLIDEAMIEKHGDHLLPSPLGKATANAGLLPSTSAAFVELLRSHGKELEDHFDEFITGILYWACSADEFAGDTPSRFLPYPSEYSAGSLPFISGKRLLQPIDRTNTKLAQSTHALALYVEGVADRKIAFFTHISSGNLHRLAIDVSWVLDGLHRISTVPDLGCPQHLSNRISMLSRRVRWGAPAEAIDVIRVAEIHGVPGFGRQRAMTLLAHGISTFDDILCLAKEKLVDILRNEQRATSLLVAVAGAMGLHSNRLAKTHDRVAKQLGIDKVVEDCNTKLGTEYEDAIAELLRVELSWVVSVIDDGKRQNVPDLLVTLNDVEVLIECKTCTKMPSLIKKEEAFAVLQKAADFAPRMRRVTLGKPAFDEHSKLKAQASPDITLVEHAIFMEGILRLHAGEIKPIEFLKWISEPGITEMDRLIGKPTYLIE